MEFFFVLLVLRVAEVPGFVLALLALAFIGKLVRSGLAGHRHGAGRQ